MSVLYFAYGSNMSLKQIQDRCPDCKKVAIGVLRDHNLVFLSYSKNRKCGVASIEVSQGDEVWGVVYELSDADLAKLDKCEGYNPHHAPHKNSYNRASISVNLCGHLERQCNCLTYFATVQAGTFLPNEEYKRAIQRGAEENGLPESYIDKLRDISVISV